MKILIHLVSGRVAVDIKGKISSKMNLHLVLTSDGHYLQLPRSVISRDISSGNSTNTFIFWVRPDDQGASKVYFYLGANAIFKCLSC